MAKISVYFNKFASQTNAELWEKELRRKFFRHDIVFKAPNSLENLKAEIESDKRKQVDFIFCLGGDGTVNTILQNLRSGKLAKTKLMVIPTGTANDFASELGIVSNINTISKMFIHHTTKKIDLININDRVMATNGGIGFITNVVEEINLYRKKYKTYQEFMKKIKSEIYSLVYIKKLIMDSLPIHRLYIDSPDSTLMDKIVETPLVLINNQRSLGKNFHVAPKTKNDDGKFNVTIFKHKNKKDFMEVALKFRLGFYPENDPNLISFETDRVEIMNTANYPLRFFGDGDILLEDKNFSINLSGQKQEVCFHDENNDYNKTYKLDTIEMI
ncbi:MAG: NAD(+)/NADH kinase [Halobacteriovoraceae bacterium]|nr:NAD(+)/NADH kinase [Halobacteriovoraceae bacterium]MCB9094013.1 NAD(+)/NADH kinase [Halobacteriovoraceae bacterium]